MSSEDLHVPREVLSQEARLLHYAITSLKEELDAVDWYRQRADDTEDEALREILLTRRRCSNGSGGVTATSPDT